jgi:hypothetical protein
MLESGLHDSKKGAGVARAKRQEEITAGFQVPLQLTNQ